MRGRWAAAAFVALFLPAMGEPWTEFSGPYGVSLRLPPGSVAAPYAEGITRVALPVPVGTLLTEFSLLIEAGSGSPPPGEPLWLGRRRFYLRHWTEGAAGSRYESFRFASRPERGRWIALTFVIRTAVPGVFAVPAPSYDRGAILGVMWRILASARFPAPEVRPP